MTAAFFAVQITIPGGYDRHMLFPQLARFTDVALLLLRIMIGIVFMTSGWKHVQHAEARSKDIGMSKGFTIFLGFAELAASLGVIFGVLAQLAAVVLILITLGAIQKKIFVWRTGFWGKSGTNGWSYDTMLLVMSLVIVTTGGGSIVLGKYFGLAAFDKLREAVPAYASEPIKPDQFAKQILVET
jgi:putative oxidoreductase